MRSVSLVLGAVVSVFAFGVVGCTVEGPGDEQTETSTEAFSKACLPSSVDCKPCPANKVCPAIACICDVPPGQVSSCTFIAACIQGYTWDDKSCSCVPAH